MALTITAQIISIASMVIMVFSFQMKRNRYLFAMQIAASVGFAVSYFMLGSPIGAMFNIGGMLRCIAFSIPKLKNKYGVLFILELYFIVVTFFTYGGLISLFLLAAQLISTYFMWMDNGKLIRVSLVCYVSPVWLINNIIVGSIGGVLCETFNIISILVSFARYGLSGFEK
ncbi:MAG: YgjV family protein [Clostridia bacterium]|nr:YgjV family protein [Clostridia bacterium]